MLHESRVLSLSKNCRVYPGFDTDVEKLQQRNILQVRGEHLKPCHMANPRFNVISRGSYGGPMWVVTKTGKEHCRHIPTPRNIWALHLLGSEEWKHTRVDVHACRLQLPSQCHAANQEMLEHGPSKPLSQGWRFGIKVGVSRISDKRSVFLCYHWYEFMNYSSSLIIPRKWSTQKIQKRYIET